MLALTSPFSTRFPVLLLCFMFLGILPASLVVSGAVCVEVGPCIHSCVASDPPLPCILPCLHPATH